MCVCVSFCPCDPCLAGLLWPKPRHRHFYREHTVRIVWSLSRRPCPGLCPQCVRVFVSFLGFLETRLLWRRCVSLWHITSIFLIQSALVIFFHYFLPSSEQTWEMRIMTLEEETQELPTHSRCSVPLSGRMASSWLRQAFHFYKLLHLYFSQCWESSVGNHDQHTFERLIISKKILVRSLLEMNKMQNE